MPSESIEDHTPRIPPVIWLIEGTRGTCLGRRCVFGCFVSWPVHYWRCQRLQSHSFGAFISLSEWRRGSRHAIAAMECFAAVARQRHHERSLVAKGHYRTSDVGGLEVLWAGRCHGLCGTLIFDLPHAGMCFLQRVLDFQSGITFHIWI